MLNAAGCCRHHMHGFARLPACMPPAPPAAESEGGASGTQPSVDGRAKPAHSSQSGKSPGTVSKQLGCLLGRAGHHLTAKAGLHCALRLPTTGPPHGWIVPELKGPCRHARPAPACTQAGSRGGGVDLKALIDKMEIIDPADIQLLRFLGSGGCALARDFGHPACHRHQLATDIQLLRPAVHGMLPQVWRRVPGALARQRRRRQVPQPQPLLWRR